MSSTSAIIAEALRREPLGAYLQEVRELGRANLPPGTRAKMAALYRLLRALADTGPASSKSYDQTLLFAVDFLWAEHELCSNPKPRYPIYTNIRVLDRYIGCNSYLPLDEIWRRCRYAASAIARDWLEYEQDALDNALSGQDVYGRIGFDLDSVKDRVKKLKLISGRLSGSGAPLLSRIEDLPADFYPDDWSYFANHERGLPYIAHAITLPQSKWHDEYLFIRTIHLNEICFWAIINGIRAATNALRDGLYGEATDAIRQSAFFADLLTDIFGAFKTMPKASFFDGFREATGDSSAIQSEKFQTLEILSRGIHEGKRRAISHHPELAWLQSWVPPTDATLRGLVDAVRRVPEHRPILVEAERLDAALYMWRTTHLGIARQYLPKVDAKTGEETAGTGGEGIPYLERFLRTPEIFQQKAPEAVDPEAPFLVVAPHAVASTSTAEVCAIKASEIDASAAEKFIADLAQNVMPSLDGASPDRDRAFAAYQKFFGSYGRGYPLSKQLETAIRKGSLPSDPAVALLLGLELQTGVLMGVHDLSRVTLPIQLGLAAGGQTFVGINGALQKLQAGEWIFYDAKGTFASYVKGPDSRTKVVWPQGENRRTLSLLFLILGVPDLPRTIFDKAVDQTIDTLRRLTDHVSISRLPESSK